MIILVNIVMFSAFISPVPLTSGRLSSFSSARGSIKPVFTTSYHPISARNAKSPNTTHMVLSFLQNTVDDFVEDLSLDVKQWQYKWSHELIADASMVKGVPRAEFPSLEFIAILIPLISELLSNSAAVQENSKRKLLEVSSYSDQAKKEISKYGEAALDSKFDVIAKSLEGIVRNPISSEDDLRSIIENLSDLHKSISSVEFITKAGLKEEEVLKCVEPDPFQKYKDLFTHFDIRNISFGNKFMDDKVFGWCRIAGPNPMMLQCATLTHLKHFPELTTSIFNGIPHFENDSVNAAFTGKRLYIVDYSELKGVKPGVYKDGTPKPMQLYAPIALFAVPEQKVKGSPLLPIAIHVESDDINRTYTANKNHTASISWDAAKLAVSVADGNMHEIKYHLGQCHLLMEVFVCATHRTIPSDHPLYNLLIPHFEGTTFINWLAALTLVADDTIVDHLCPPDISVAREMAARSVNGSDSSFNQMMPDTDLNNRDVLDPVLSYPYRDDALALWNIITDWVEPHVMSAYSSDSDVVNDEDLKNWCEELTGPKEGNLHGFGDNENGKILTRKYLIRCLSMIIFSATAQHAAMNMAQGEIMQFTPGLPLAMYGKLPDLDGKGIEDEKDLVSKLYPPTTGKNQAYEQVTTMQLIGKLKYTRLGHFKEKYVAEEFEDDNNEMLRKLEIYEKVVRRRNEDEFDEGLPPYIYMLPSKIPNSLNI